MNDTFTCHKCGVEKPIGAFSVDHKSKTGRSYRCKVCTRQYQIAHESTTALKRHEYQMKSLYKLSLAEYLVLREQQGGRCPICGRADIGVDPASLIGTLVVDHDHESGDVRGLLCAAHNRGLGIFSDDPQLLRNAADYLDRVRQRDRVE